MTILALTETLTKLKIDPSWAEPLAEVFQRYEINTLTSRRWKRTLTTAQMV